ncbi:DUF2157 domain-containing protein [Candidatus Giovannonibacteria bacterium]|nr:DUF2157 domain-containing protein [Candidatus Giovannonibacteria bacterium]
MANKAEILKFIRDVSKENLVSREELVSAFEEGRGEMRDRVFTNKLGMSEILYYIGGGIVFLGIAILVWQNWDFLSPLTRILVTLGSGITAYIVGVVFQKREDIEVIGSAFFLLSAMLLPIGLVVFFDNAGLDAGSDGSQSFISGVLIVVFLLSYFLFKKNIFAFFSIIFSTWFFFAFTNFLVGSNPIVAEWDFFQYRALIAGFTYLLLGYAFSKTDKAPISQFLYSFGILGFLGAAFTLGGWEPKQNFFWEMIYPLLIFATLFASVHVESKSFLVFGTIFLMIYILKITAEYFTEGLGWPFALVIAGFLMIGAGYMSISLKKKYFPE